jgi:hypothetical protein
MSSCNDPSFDEHLHAAHARHERDLDDAEMEARTVCDACERHGVPDGDDTCVLCAAERCEECGIMSGAPLARHALPVWGAFAQLTGRTISLRCCDDCAAGGIALPRFIAWLSGGAL